MNSIKLKMDYELCPGIKNAVIWLQARGWHTTDSGDGTHLAEGMEDAFPYDHVFIQIGYDEDWRSLTNLLYAQLQEANCSNVEIQLMYSPKDQIPLIMVADPDFSYELRTL